MFYTFYSQNLHISEKSSNFARKDVINDDEKKSIYNPIA